jgi:urease accessory protein
MGESLRDAQFIDHIEIRGPAAPLYLDRLRLAGDIAGHLGRRAVAGSANAMATLVYVAPDAGARLAPLRALLPATAGASLIRETLLCIRILAPDSFVLRQSLIPILNRLTGDDLPRTWTI